MAEKEVKEQAAKDPKVAKKVDSGLEVDVTLAEDVNFLVNGKRYIFKKGQKVKVPRAVKEILLAGEKLQAV